MADLERLAGNPAEAGACLQEAVAVAARIGHNLALASLSSRRTPVRRDRALG